MKRIAAPMVGAMLSSALLTLVVIPAVYSLWKEWELRRTRLPRVPLPAIEELAAPEPEAEPAAVGV